MSGRGYPSSDRQVSDLRPPTTANVSALDPTAGERRHDRGCAAGITNGATRCQCAIPDADDASEPLTEAEVDTLADAFVAANRAEFMDTDFDLPIQQAVERIKAAAATKARADERERIAQAIEALPSVTERAPDGWVSRSGAAARIARGDA